MGTVHAARKKITSPGGTFDIEPSFIQLRGALVVFVHVNLIVFCLFVYLFIFTDYTFTLGAHVVARNVS